MSPRAHEMGLVKVEMSNKYKMHKAFLNIIWKIINVKHNCYIDCMFKSLYFGQNISHWLPFFLFYILNVPTKKFMITYVHPIVFLLDIASLNILLSLHGPWEISVSHHIVKNSRLRLVGMKGKKRNGKLIRRGKISIVLGAFSMCSYWNVLVFVNIYFFDCIISQANVIFVIFCCYPTFLSLGLSFFSN